MLQGNSVQEVFVLDDELFVNLKLAIAGQLVDNTPEVEELFNFSTPSLNKARVNSY